MQLPYELQSLVMAYVMHDRLNASNILCVCWRFHELGVPILYREAHERFGSRRDSQKLLKTLIKRPDYAQHVREAAVTSVYGYLEDRQKLIRFANAINTTKVHSVGITFNDGWMGAISEMLRLLKPRSLVLRLYYIWHNLNPISFARALLDARNTTEWLSQLVTLTLVDVEVDTASARIICQLPNLKELTLDVAHLKPSSSFVRVISTVFTLGYTRTNLDWFVVYSYSTSERRLIQRTMGICIPSMGIRDFHRSARHSRIYHGCQKIKETQSELISDCIQCPRCCAIAGWDAEEAPNSTSTPPRDSADPTSTTDAVEIVEVQDQNALSISIGPRYGLCGEHYDEIPANLDTLNESAFLHRRLLESMRWIVAPDGQHF